MSLKKLTIIFGVAAVVLYIAARIFMICEENLLTMVMVLFTLYTSRGCMVLAIISFIIMLIINRSKP